MVHVELAAAMMGLDHAYIPPHEQSLNEAEKVCLQIWDDAASLMIRSKAPGKLFAEAVSMAMYVDLRMSTTASRGYKTPIEIISGIQPNINKLHRFFTAAFVCVPKQKPIHNSFNPSAYVRGEMHMHTLVSELLRYQLPLVLPTSSNQKVVAHLPFARGS